jgi:hypothetical protein
MAKAERDLLSKGLVDLANIVAGALVFGQIVSGTRFSIIVFIVGVLLTIALYTAGLAFSYRGRDAKL